MQAMPMPPTSFDPVSGVTSEDLDVLSALMDAPAALCIARGPEHVLEFANHACEEVLGRTDLCGRPLKQALPELAGSGLLELADQVYRTGEAYLAPELRLPLLRGGLAEHSHFRLLVEPLRGTAGAVAGLLLVATDITEQTRARQRAEELARALEGREFQLRAVVDALDEGVVVIAADGSLVMANRSARKLLDRRGRAQEGMAGWRAEIEYVREDGARCPDAELPIALALATGQSQPATVLGMRSTLDGKVHWYSAHARVIPAADPAQRQVVCSFFDLTEQRAAEGNARALAAEVHQKQQQLNAVLGALPQAVILVEAPTGRLLYANPPAEKLLKLRESGPRCLARDAHGEVLDFEQLPFMRAARGERVDGELLQLEAKDGRVMLLRTHVRPIHDPEGRLSGGVVAYEDVTEHQALLAREQGARAAAERSERELRSIADAIPHHVIVGEPGGRASFANRRLLEYVGQGLTFFNQSRWLRAVHPDDRARTAARWKEANDRKIPVEIELRLRRADGAYRWFLVRGMPLVDAPGGPVRWFSTATDVHGQKQAEWRWRFLSEASAELAGATDFDAALRKLTELAVPGFADGAVADVIEPDGRVRRVAVSHQRPGAVGLMWNAAGQFGDQLDERLGLGRVLRQGKHEFFPEVDLDMLRSQVADPALLQFYVDLRMRSLIEVPLTARGRTLGALIFLCEEGRRFGNDDLELALELGRRAGLAIDNGRLLRDSEAANRAKDEFLAVVSHELRTPLTAVLGYTSMLRAGTLSEERKTRAVEVIDRNVRAQSQLIEDLLDISRISSGKLRLHVRSTRAQEIIEAALAAVRPAAEAKGIVLSGAPSTEVGPLLADPDRLQQVIWNLLSNAIKFTPAGGRVEVLLRGGEGQAQISVRDTGQGIAPAFLPYVFERFRQADPSSTRTHGGLGLGLAIVKHVVELHGGRVEVESEGSGRGATFRITLPLAGAEAAQARRQTPPGLHVWRPQGELRGLKVLMVDAPSRTHDALAFALEHAGAAVREESCSNVGRTALDLGSFDVVIAELSAHEASGLELMKALRALPEEKGGRIPAVALVADRRPELGVRARAAGFDAQLLRPVHPLELVRVLVELTRKA
ncbi:MAG: PAS domain S-box protein [Deltaproteobacteria bacterium]|nr:PAS domain S-box protein [Deltaproteobacteria bacterium]